MKELANNPLARVAAVALLGAASVLWPKLAPAAGFLALVAWLALPALPREQLRLARFGLTLAVLLSTGGFLRFVISEAIPGVIAGGQAAATKHGLAFARSIIVAQDHVRQSAGFDPDGDGVGSALTLPELAGAVPLRDGRTLLPSPLYLTPNQIVTTPSAVLVQNGAYFYKLCLPVKGGAFSAAPTAPERDDEAAERRYLVYAWPAAFGPGGPKQCLFLDEHERILVLDADADGRARYHGLSAAPECDAALTSKDWVAWRDKQPRTALPGDR